MKIAVLGTGMVGQPSPAGSPSWATTSTIGTRDPQATLARTEPDAMGNPPFAAWHAEHPESRLATFAEAAAAGRAGRQRDQRRRLPRRR